jgi:alpha-amylase/alpha-mannosidase (GH57 family)
VTPRYVCIHGHFYQPPRENPWLEAVERQESAAPYHDWNHRVTAECYAPNAASRILNGDGRIRQIMNNYARISFNFGPTLLSWMEEYHPDVYAAVIEADRRSIRRFGGHGSAMAQAFNHTILPLSNSRDKRTQVLWGVRDFEHRYGRPPEGMWLPEAAVDLESLDVMAEMGIRFTVLAPSQAESIRPTGSKAWRPAGNDRSLTGRVYKVELPSGRDIAVFFYHGHLSRGVAFERLLTDGAHFTDRILGAFEGLQGDAPLIHLATDGETYGHHHRHGEMALSFAIRSLVHGDDVELTNYGEYLELHPPTWDARIRENTSWSCFHGIERWRSDCGCHVADRPDWNQAWREPLRKSLDWLRDQLVPRWEQAAAEVFRDPWAARDRYVEVLLDRSDECVGAFLNATTGGIPEDQTRALRLMELQRHLMLMYTSCGWFFDDISGIEAVQVLRYAGRVLDIAEDLFPGHGLNAPFLERLGEAKSNILHAGSGRDVFVQHVLPSKVNLAKAAAHYAVSSVFDRYDPVETIYCYRFERKDERRFESGRASLVMGRVRVTSLVTRKSRDLSYGVLHFGNHNITGGVRLHRSAESYEALVDEVSMPFNRADFATVIRVLDQEFEASTYSLRSLFRDAQFRIVETILETNVEEVEAALREIYEERAPLLRFLADLGIPAPRPIQMAGEYVVNTRLKRIFDEDRPDLAAVRDILKEAASARLALDRAEVSYRAERALEREISVLRDSPEDLDALERLRDFVELLEESPLPVDLWRVQNVYWGLIKATGLAAEAAIEENDEPALGPQPSGAGSPAAGTAERTAWLHQIRVLGGTLGMEATLA